MQPTEDHLRALSEHVLYEVKMLFGAAELLESHATPGRASLPSWTIEMALIESFAIHARVLRDFLYNERGKHGKPTDGLAEDYFQPTEWKRLRPSEEDALAAVNKRVQTTVPTRSAR